MKKILPYCALLYTFGFGGLDFVFLQILSEDLQSGTIVFVRTLVSMVMFVVIATINNNFHKKDDGGNKKNMFCIERKDSPRFFIAGALGICIYYFLETLGIQELSASLATILLATIPIFGMISDFIFFGNSVTVKKAAIIAISMIGVMIVTRGEISGNAKGLIFITLASATWVAYIVIIKPLNSKYSELTIAMYLFMSGAVTALPLMLIQAGSEILQIETHQWAMLVLTAIIFIAVGQKAYIYAIGRLSVTISSIFPNLLPVVTVTSSIFVFDTVPKINHVIGGGVIIASVVAIVILDSQADTNVEEEIV